ncbi:16S rRNA (adenine(1518)-N(6)/adenine(1519)-N(6))-dimethyltransferase RsmA [Alicyclobacillus fastidiosus]|uniref:Ribosomal RNA small subunit methyltransferase A n=1 Tax=Alicyclobacillus fastidiosus TaxID=392011 RepID=A0ABV5AF60_9BACL|nr:16S rRNA (adenine(1518)-N(6)/adenine(1519)-N(6))-dimethyltransferase RsmA [Alicyclobacillus fastidiosus]WEH09918.1 16S rRNA (adenine(1518)-N(6)/adenine(1519)-N(6))-dimethyltransferase RsmA [Alicyclobacillus fastidiosus]
MTAGERETSPRMRELLHKHDFHTKKQFGQNFLIDQNVLDRIAEAVRPDGHTLVLEIGPGAGALTVELARKAAQVVAIEKDETLRPVLQDVLAPYPNVEVTFADVLEVDLARLLQPYLTENRTLCFAANLPYYITTPILFQVLEANLPLERAVVMVQKEVADRMVADPGGKEYGVLSVGIQYRASAKRLFTVPPGAFAPQPGVDSAVVLLDCTRPTGVRVEDEKVFFRVVKAAFSTRRKTLLNALSNSMGLPKDACKAWIEHAGVRPEARAETLSIEQFAALANQYVTLAQA